VGASVGWVVPLTEAADCEQSQVGGKAAKLGLLTGAGFRVPAGFAITSTAYERFVKEQDLAPLIGMELERKDFGSMRWEEIWDVALRIRSAFLAAPMPQALGQAIIQAADDLALNYPLVVRSSAPGEDSANRSFAGLHESVVGISSAEDVLDAVRVVWASLWSDAALLYRQELALDPSLSRMAVVVQEMVEEDRSGVAFGRDPRQSSLNHAIVEAVPGPCGDLVDGLVDPDRWILERATGQVLEWRSGDREDKESGPLLAGEDLSTLLDMLHKVESLLDWPPDTEWTGRGERFTLLQARPITTTAAPDRDERNWYLSLRPGMRRLSELADRVAGALIPELEALGQRFAAEPVEEMEDPHLAIAIEERHTALEKWRQVYLDDFIPFAHGVRQLGIYYNDAVRPADPYEFVDLLGGQQMLASQRNDALRALGRQVQSNNELRAAISDLAPQDGQLDIDELMMVPGGEAFVQGFRRLAAEDMDVAYGGERLSSLSHHLLRTVLELAESPVAKQPPTPTAGPEPTSIQALEQRFFDAAGPERSDEAREILEIGRLSWRLRDDDNVLIGRLESQLLRTLETAASRLHKEGRLAPDARVSLASAPALGHALRNPSEKAVVLPEETIPTPTAPDSPGASPRQLVGQPAAPGLATGRVRRVQNSDDLGAFRSGEILVCDAIQPTMTHLVPLASAIVERRGGMLIHGAIIARELGIPCVNGVVNAVQILDDGQVVTVDGHLGIVTVGVPEFDLEDV
jgi:pyruvate,water dikinase